MMARDFYKDVLLGVAIGDALGVPVEFKSREAIKANPLTGMIGFGTHNQPPGTFSDDSSMTFCLAEALTQGFDLNTIAQNFIKWLHNNYWAAGSEVFDVGIATREAIGRLAKGETPELAGGYHISSNGNGSLMRILPLVFYTKNQPIEERYRITKLVSSITHAHFRSVFSCFYYLEFARELLLGKNKFDAYKTVQIQANDFLRTSTFNREEIALFDRLLQGNINELPESQISSSGYVIHTLEASTWCLLTTDNFADAVLKAVNLGDDTDTTGAVTGGIAALLYGCDTIPETWQMQLARKDSIVDLAERLAEKSGQY